MSMMKKWAKFKFNPKARLEFYQKLCTFIDDGVSLDEILTRMHEIYSEDDNILGFMDVRPFIAKDISTKMKSGNTFADSLGEWVPSNEQSLIASGEEGGGLSNAMRDAITVTEALIAIKNTLVAGLSYPGLLLVVLVGMMFAFALNIIPQLAEMIPPDRWEGPSASLYTFSTGLTSNWPYGLAAIIGFAAFSKLTIPSYTGPARKYLDKIPPYSIYKTIQSASFLIAISAMMRTGVPFEKSLNKQIEMTSAYNAFFINMMLKALRDGARDGESLNVGYFDKTVTQDIRFYGDSSDFQKVIDIIGRSMVMKAIVSIESSTGKIKTAVIASLGLFIAWTYYAFFTLTQSIGQAAAAAG